MSNKQQIEDTLKKLILNDDREFVAMLSGEWGMGKTYFWQKFTKNHLKDKDVVYISLFGKNSLADIESEILTKLYKYNKSIKKYTKHLNTVSNMASKAIGLPINVSAGSLLSLFSPNDFKNIIICFDDFERLSDKVPLKDVLGLISQFKEQKECKVIMILNEGELDKLSGIDGKKHDEVFALYKEKVIDYTFHYKPSQEELFEAIKPEIEQIKFCDHQVIYNFFKKIDLKNIRIMKQALYQLKHFSFIENQNFDEIVVNEFVRIALNLFVFKAKSNYTYSDYQDMKEYESVKTVQRISENEHFKTNNKHEQNLKFYYQPQDDPFLELYYSQNKNVLEKIVYGFIDNHSLMEQDLQKQLEKNNQSLDWYDIRNEISELNTRFFTDFSILNNTISEAILTLLEKHKDDMPYLFTIGDFLPILKNIKTFTDRDISVLEEEIIQKYIVYHVLDYNEEMIESIDKKFNYADKYISEEREKIRTTSKKPIDTILHEIIKKRHVSTQNALLLSSLDVKMYQEYIKKSHTCVNLIIEVLKNYRSETKLSKTIHDIENALVALKDENPDYTWKVDQILKNGNIKLEENE